MEYTVVVFFDRHDGAGEPRIEVFYPASDLAVVAFVGEHDVSTSRHAHETLFEVLGVLAPDALLVADLGNATFIDASIVGCLVEADNRAAELGIVFRLEPGEASVVREAFRVTGAATAAHVPHLN